VLASVQEDFRRYPRPDTRGVKGNCQMHRRTVGTLLAFFLALGGLALAPAGAAPAGQDYLTFRPLANAIAPMVVSVQARWSKMQGGREIFLQGDVGSGFVYDHQGHVVTSYSNIAMAPSSFINPRDPRASAPDHIAEYIKVVFQDRAAYQGKVVGYDKDLDIAVLKLEGIRRRALEPLPLVESENYRLGQPILTLAYNFLTRDKINVSFGVVSAMRSQFPSLEDSANDFIQVAFPKNAGYDGGAIVDLEGRVVAMITSVTPYSDVEEVHFGVPAGLLQDRIDKIIQFGYIPRAWFGFNMIALNDSVRRSYNVPAEVEGMFIVHVQPGSPAATAGLRSGDILVEFNGVKIDSLEALKNQLELLSIGETANLVYLRRDFNALDRFSTDFTLLEKPKEEGVSNDPTSRRTMGGAHPHY